MLSNFSTSCGALRIHGDIHGVTISWKKFHGAVRICNPDSQVAFASRDGR